MDFCESLVHTFKWDAEYVMGFSFDERKKFITSLLECLLELYERGLLNSNIYGEEIIDFMDILEKNKIDFSLITHSIDIIKEKIALLSDNQKKSEIIDFYKILNKRA